MTAARQRNKDKMAIEFGDATYTSTDGAVTMKLADLPLSTIINACTRAFNHVMGNEAIAKVAAARKKDPGLTDEQVQSIIAEAQRNYVQQMQAGQWGEASGRAPRGPAANRLEQIFNNLLADATRKAIANAGYKSGDEKNTWLVPGNDGGEIVVTLADVSERYLANAKLGAERRALLEKQAADKYEAEKKDAEHRKAAKAAESGAAKPASLDDI
jgi:hypothetical protein